MLDDIVLLQEHMKGLRKLPQADVVPDSIFAARNNLGRNSVDLAVTSPPYLNNYHYPRNTRPQIHWLRFASGTGYGGARESDSFGKFWQTVRDLPAIPLAFEHKPLAATIEQIRNRNTEKGQYGGAGWANYVATYFNDTYRFSRLLRTLLKKNGVAVIVLGNSVIQGVEVRTDQYFGEIAELCGLAYENNLLLRKKRTGTSIIKSSVRVDAATDKVVLYESAVVLRKLK
jgi:DNA modification methylase